jgi:hypothetical protein
MIIAISRLGGICQHFFIFSGNPYVNDGALKVQGSPVSSSEFLSPNQLGLQGLGEKGDHFFKVFADDM